MNNNSKFNFFVAVATLIVSILAVGKVEAQRTSKILQRMDAHYKNLQTLQADITMEKHNNQLDEKDITTGKFKYVPKKTKNVMYIRVDWLKPVEESMSVIGNSYRIYRRKQEQVYEGKTNNAKNNAKAGNALAFLSMSRKELSDNYTYLDLGDETVSGGIETVHLQLTPRTVTSYKMAHLWVDNDGIPVMVKIVEKNNDTTTVLMSNIKENLTLNGDDFDIKYPKYIKPIRE